MLVSAFAHPLLCPVKRVIKQILKGCQKDKAAQNERPVLGIEFLC